MNVNLIERGEEYFQRNRYLHRMVILFLTIILVVGCGSATQLSSPPPAQDQELGEYWPTGGWRTSTSEEQGIDSGKLVEMLEFVQQEKYDVDSILIIRHGYKVVEASFHPFTGDQKHILYSCTKSVVSALIGIAIDEGYIKGVDTPVLDFFPDRIIENLDSNKQEMNLEHLLSMTTGFECRDSYLYNFHGLRLMHESDDWVQHVLDLPMIEPPGTTFEYCNGASFLLSAIIQETTGVSALDFAQEHLFAPLGITDVFWEVNPDGINMGYSDLYLSPKDMAKFGYLYLHDGEWDGEQIISTEWVEGSTQEYISATLQDGYGFQWWIDYAGYYMALGYRGQFIFILPELEMVVVVVSDPEVGDYEVPEYLLTTYIIPAVLSDVSLPENPESLALLEAAIEELVNPESQE